MMDGTRSDKRSGGRLVRSLSVEDACTYYPQLVLDIANGSVEIPADMSADGNGPALVIRALDRTVEIDRGDLVKCMRIATRLGSTPLFPSDPSIDLARARALIEVEFA